MGKHGYASNMTRKSEARHKGHSAMMTAFHEFLASLGDLRPMEGEPRWSGMLAAFKAGWNAR